MIDIICAVSGLSFQYDNRRAKKHPKIAEAESLYNKRNQYREYNIAVKEVKANGGYTTVEEFLELVKSVVYRQLNVQLDIRRAEREAEENRKKALADKNALLSKNGYKWRKTTETSWEEDRTVSYFWIEAPDGLECSEAQAMEAIRRGVEIGVIRAEDKAKKQTERERYEAEQAAIADAERAEDRRVAEECAAFDAEVTRLTAGLVRVERFTCREPKRTLVYHIRPRWSGSYRRYDHINTFRYNGQKVIEVVDNSGFDDDGYTSYYVANPEAVGLTRTKKG